MGARRVLAWNPDCGTAAALGAFAQQVGWTARVPAELKPEDYPEDTRLVLLDLSDGSPAAPLAEAERRWRETHRPWCWLREPADVPSRDDGAPRWPRALSVSECLRTGAPGGSEGALAAWTKDPAIWAEDCGAPSGSAGLRRRLARVGAGADFDARWREALEWFAKPHRLRAFADLWLAVAPRALRPLAAEAAACAIRARHPWWRLGTALPGTPLLVLYAEDGDWTIGDGPPPAVVAVDLWTWQDDFPACPAPEAGLIFTTAAGGPHFGRCLRLDLSGAPRDALAQQARLNRLISAVCNRLLHDGRPLRHFGCTLLFPFAPADADSKELAETLGANQRAVPAHYPEHADASLSEDERQAMLYFLPDMRRLLYAPDDQPQTGGLDPLREWRLTVGANDRLIVEGPEPGLPPTAARVESLRLFRYFNGCHVLALRVSAEPGPACALDGEAARLAGDGDDWWRALAFSGPAAFAEIEGLQLTRWLNWTRQARILYQTFTEQYDEDKLRPLTLWLGDAEIRAFDAPAAGQEAKRSRIIRELLRRLFAPDSAGLADGTPLPDADRRVLEALARIEPHDPRLFVNVAYGLAGPPPEPETLERLYALALFVDRPEDTFQSCDRYAYDPVWVKKALEDASLRLWEATGIYSGATGYSHAHIGCGGFFCQIVAPRHVPQMYERMLLQALFYQTSLRLYSRRIAEATKVLAGDNSPGGWEARATAVSALRKEFIRFTNQYWFHELTPQLQGRALFELQQRALGLDREYELVKDEMERTDEYLLALREQRAAKLTVNLALAAMVVAVVALWVAVLPLVPLDGDIDWPRWTGEAWELYLRRAFWLGALVLVPVGLLLALIWRPFRRWLRR